MGTRQLTVLLAGIALVGCGDESERVTGKGPLDPTTPFGQSETAIATSELYPSGTNVIVSFNDDTGDPHLSYTPTNRLVTRGASQMGWALSSDFGRTWRYKGRVPPPAGWSIIWSDPALAARTLDNGFKGAVFLTNIASPDDVFPPAGQTGGLSSVLAGACIARSLDGGETFAIAQCVRQANHFYDGSSIAIAGSGRVCSAYNDFTARTINFWCAESLLGSFVRRPDPFDSLISHPRLRAAPTGGDIYAAARAGERLLMAKWDGARWSPPVAVNYLPMTSAPEITLGPVDFTGKRRSVRSAVQFAFDVSPTASPTGNDEVRIVYSTLGNDGRFHLYGTACSANLTNCRAVPAWTTGAWTGGPARAGHQWNPRLAVSPSLGNGQPVWKVAFDTTEDDLVNARIAIKQGNLAWIPTSGGQYLFQPFDSVGPREICPSTFSAYWGDYDSIAFMRHTDSGVPEFITSFSDSSRGCVSRWDFTSSEVHVSTAILR